MECFILFLGTGCGVGDGWRRCHLEVGARDFAGSGVVAWNGLFDCIYCGLDGKYNPDGSQTSFMVII